MKSFKDKLIVRWPSLHPNPPQVTPVNSLAYILPDYSPGRAIFLKYKSHEVPPLLQTLSWLPLTPGLSPE